MQATHRLMFQMTYLVLRSLQDRASMRNDYECFLELLDTAYQDDWTESRFRTLQSLSGADFDQSVDVKIDGNPIHISLEVAQNILICVL